MKIKSIVAVLATVMAVGLLYTGCGGGGGGDSIPGSSVKIVGKLIDRTSRKVICNEDPTKTTSDCVADGGIAVRDVVVGVRAGKTIVNCSIEKKNKTSDSDKGSVDNLFNEAGLFECDVPLANLYEVRAMATGYATYGLRFSPVSYDDAYGAASTGSGTVAKIQDIGNIQLTQAVTATVHVVDALTGAAVTGATVYATPFRIADQDIRTGAAGAIGGLGSNNALGAIEIAVTDGSADSAAPDLVADLVTASDGTTTAGTADGSIEIPGLNSQVPYTFVVPAYDSDADGSYDYVTGVDAQTLDSFQGDINNAGGFNGIGEVPELTIALTAVGHDAGSGILTSNCTQYGQDGDLVGNYPGCILTVGQAGLVVFTRPVEDISADGDNIALYLNAEAAFIPALPWFSGANVALDFDGDGATTTALAYVDVTPTLSAGNTVLTITPAADLTAGGIYTLAGTVTTRDVNDNAVQGTATINLSTILGIAGIYIIPAALGDIADPTVDNFNGSSDASGGVTAVVLNFDRAVYGSYTVMSTVTGTTTTTIDPPAVAGITGVNLNYINLGGNEAGIGGGGSGCTPSAAATATCPVLNTTLVYGVPLVASPALNDNIAATPSTVTVNIDVTDIQGNTLRKTLTLAVN